MVRCVLGRDGPVLERSATQPNLTHKKETNHKLTTSNLTHKTTTLPQPHNPHPKQQPLASPPSLTPKRNINKRHQGMGTTLSRRKGVGLLFLVPTSVMASKAPAW